MYIKSGGAELVTVVRKETIVSYYIKLINRNIDLRTILEEEDKIAPSKLVNVKDGSTNLKIIL